MKRYLLFIYFAISSLFMFAIDPSGSHYVNYEDNDAGLPAPIMLGLLLIVSIIAIIFGKSVDKDSSFIKNLGYIGLVAFVIFSAMTCS